MAETETPARRHPAAGIVETLLGELWKKVRKAAARIEELRLENNRLQTRIEELEHSMSTMEALLTQKEEKIESLEKHPPHYTAIEVGERLLYLSPDEREALERQIDDLLRRINTHLGSDLG